PAAAARIRSATASTSSDGSPTIMYSISIPNPSNSRRPAAASSTPPSFTLSLLDPGKKSAHDRVVEPVPERGVLDAMLDARVIVHLDDIDLAVDLLEVDPIEAAADQVCHAQCGRHHGGRCLVERDRLEAAFVRPAGAVALDDLPMPPHHVVATGVERLAVEDADAPVE